MQTYREGPSVEVVETTFQAPNPVSYFVLGAVLIGLVVVPIALHLGTVGIVLMGLPLAAFGGGLLWAGLRERAMRVTVSALGLRIEDGKVFECPWSEVEEVRTGSTAVGYARMVPVRILVRRDGQEIPLPLWLDADFDVAFARAFTAIRLRAVNVKRA